ncbi:ABC transporter substrate-binding protein [soil metagenome]
MFTSRCTLKPLEPVENERRATRRRLLAKGLLIGASLAVSSASMAQAQDPIKIGLLLTYVGPTAVFARDEDRGARLLVDQTNKAGGIGGRQIELVKYDTEGKPDRAGSLYRRLAQEDKVSAVIGPDSIFVLLGMSSVPSEMKVMSVAAPGLYELVQPQFRSYVASAWAPGTFAGTLTLAYLKDKHNVKRIGMLTTADAVGERVGKTVQTMASLFGIEVVSVVAQPASDRDLLPSLNKLANIKPPIDGLYVFGSGPFANIAMNQAELAGINVPIAYNGGNVVPDLIKEIAPDIAKRTFLVTSRSTVARTLPKDDKYKAVVDKFSADYQAQYGEPASLPAAVGYDMALAIIDGLKNVGPDREKLRDYIQTKQRITGVQGVEFARTASYGYGIDPYDLVIGSIANGQFVFSGYVKDSLDRINIKKDQITQKMRDLTMITD